MTLLKHVCTGHHRKRVASANRLGAKHGAEIIKLLGSLAIPAGMRAAIARVGNSKGEAVRSPMVRGINKTRQCLNIEQCIPNKRWADLIAATSCNKHLLNMAWLFERLGLTNVSEHTYVAAISTITLARLEATDPDKPPTRRLDDVKEVERHGEGRL